MTEAKEHSVSIHADKDGSFRRQTSAFRNTISKDGPHQPEAGRYSKSGSCSSHHRGPSCSQHSAILSVLYVALICPWACRTLHTRALKGLQDIIDVAVLDYELTPKGWTFDRRTPEATGDPVFGAQYIREIYHKVDPSYDLRYTCVA